MMPAFVETLNKSAYREVSNVTPIRINAMHKPHALPAGFCRASL